MTQEYSLPDPPWLNSLPDDEKPVAKARFRVNLAALYASQSGTVVELSKILGLHPNSLHNISGRKYLSPKNCIRVERYVGSHVARQEDLNPEFYMRIDARRHS